MKINRVSALGPRSPQRSNRGVADSSDGFAKALSADSDSQSASAVSGGTALGAVDALLALQEVANDTDGRQARRRGEDLLDQLDELRLGLLAGHLPIASVERLMSLVEARRGQVNDPRLAQILAEIEVRAAVELAKLGR